MKKCLPLIFSPSFGAVRPCRQKAFSLVEVTLALGIVGFAMIPLLGLLVNGLNLTRSNQDRFAESQIISWVGGMIRAQGDEAPTEAKYFFDAMGTHLTDNSTNALFAAEVKSDAITLPGASSSLQVWKVELYSPARNHQFLGKYIVWGQRP